MDFDNTNDEFNHTFFNNIPTVGGTTSTTDPHNLLWKEQSAGVIDLAGHDGDIVYWEAQTGTGWNPIPPETGTSSS